MLLIEHASHGRAYAWLSFSRDGRMPWYVPTPMQEDYALGIDPPHYPVPATQQDAFVMRMHLNGGFGWRSV